MTATRVMVVEDERVVALNIKRRLINMGYEVPAFASSGAQALAKIKQERPDVVLMDIHIDGDMDGIETAAQIPEEWHVPVIYLTAYSGEETLQRAQATRPDGYLLKPFSERELHATIQMAIARQHAEQQEAANTPPAPEAAPVKSSKPLAAVAGTVVRERTSTARPTLRAVPVPAGDDSSIRWGSGTRSDPTSARNRLLDAALFSYKRRGIANTSVEDIAVQAKITRTTVYRYFDSHPEILKAVIRRELNSFWEELRPQLASVQFGDYLTEMLISTLNYAETVAGREFLFSPETLPTLNEILLSDKPYLDMLMDFLTPAYQRYVSGPNGRIDGGIDGELPALCEWFNRILASYLARPSLLFSSEIELRSVLSRWMPVVQTPTAS